MSKVFLLTVLIATNISGQSRKDLLWEYKKMRDNDAHLGNALTGNVNNYSNSEIKSVLKKAWQKKETIVLLQLLDYLQNPVCTIQVFSDEEIAYALNHFAKDIAHTNLAIGDTATNMLLQEAYQTGDIVNSLPRLIGDQGLVYSNIDMLLRVFKKDLNVSLWIRPHNTGQAYRMLKTYEITDSIVSMLGPKSILGDQLTPEGIYTLEFYPSFRWSDFYLAFKVSYPNDADEQRRRFWGIEGKAGGAINLHGCCVSIGCIPVGNPAIEELFFLFRANQENGSEIPIHIFPFKFRTEQGRRLLKIYENSKKSYYDFWQGLIDIDEAFLLNKQIPLIKVDPITGYYVLD
jgi:murein L,D-transpeptidase YafK